jgi:hypothetical protein
MDEKERYLRWMETMWELHKGTTREEKRKEEILEVFKDTSANLLSSARRPRISRPGRLPGSSKPLTLPVAGVRGSSLRLPFPGHHLTS